MTDGRRRVSSDTSRRPAPQGVENGVVPQLADAPGRGRQSAGYGEALAKAIERSPFRSFPEGAQRELLERGLRLDAPGRTIVYREDDRAFCGIVVRGSLRIFTTSEDGREFTLFWAHPGEWLGASLIAGGPAGVSAQAVTDVSVHMVPADLLQSLARTDASVAWETARQVAARLQQAGVIIGMLAFMDLRQRTAHRLLELAFHQPNGAALVAIVSQQDLADAVGSPRTSVARVLADLRAEGIVRSVPGGVQLVRPERLVPGVRALTVA